MWQVSLTQQADLNKQICSQVEWMFLSLKNSHQFIPSKFTTLGKLFLD